MPLEGAAPLRHAGIVMRMRDRDRLDAAESVDQLNSGLIDQE